MSLKFALLTGCFTCVDSEKKSKTLIITMLLLCFSSFPQT